MNPDKLAEYLDEAFRQTIRASRCLLRGDPNSQKLCHAKTRAELRKAMVWVERFKLQRVTFK